MTTCDMNGYVQLENNSSRKVPCRQRRFCVVGCGILSIGIVAVLYGLAPRGSSLTNQGVDTLASIMRATLPRGQYLQPARPWQFQQPAKHTASVGQYMQLTGAQQFAQQASDLARGWQSMQPVMARQFVQRAVPPECAVEDGACLVNSAVFVTVEIKPDRIDDFLKAMEDDVTNSRDPEKDPGCYRFDLLRDRDDPNKFIFYEAYKDDDAAAFHKTTSHYNSWAEFKKSGGVVSQEVAKVETGSIPGRWAFQISDQAPLDADGKSLDQASVGSGVVVTVDIKPDRLDDFFQAIEKDVLLSRDKGLDPGCMRFDLLRDRGDPNRFYFYEAYVDDNAAGFHKTTDHYNFWAEFKKSGGVLSQSVVKVDTASIPGSWAFLR